MRAQLTDAGPVLVFEGARLQLKSRESISIEARQVKIRAEENALVESGGTIDLSSSHDTRIHSENDVQVIGKTIRLNRTILDWSRRCHATCSTSR